MSLEKAIEENTAAVRDLIGVIQLQGGAKSAALAPGKASPASAPDKSLVVNRDTVRKLLTNLIQTNTEGVVAALGKYGATKQSEVPDEKLESLYADLRALA